MSDPGFNFLADNFIGGTMFMTDSQVGKYIRALCAQKLNGHLSKENLDSIIHGDPKIAQKFVKDEDGLFYNVRLQKEIDKRIEHSKKQSDRANKRWGKRDATALPRKESGNACNETETEIDNESKKKEGIKGGKEKKIKFLEHVYLTQPEFDRLRKEFGKEFLDACIFKLNTYLTNNPKKQWGAKSGYRDHNLVIQDWVTDEIRKKMAPRPEIEKPPPPGPPKPETPEEKAAAEEAMKVFHEQTQKILNHATIRA